jgi:disulfide bond formation protein DsbB
MLARLKAWAAAEPVGAAAMVIAVGGAATILGAWLFQYGLGLAPCPLCLQQRVPHYIAVPLAALVAFAAWRGFPRHALLGGLAVLALVMLWSAGLGAYHAGVEWKWWAGPQDCAVAAPSLGTGGSLLQQMQKTRVVPCDEAAWRFLGLSLAGWNALVSLALAAVAIVGMRAARRPGAAAHFGDNRRWE